MSTTASTRQGVSLKEMTAVRHQAAMDLVRVSLGARGLELSRNIMKTDQPKRDHKHVVIRAPNGNDYGKDLLRPQLELHPH